MLKLSDLDHREKFDAVFGEELDFVKNRWTEKAARRPDWDDELKSFAPNALRGLALSGGGIRSASFCMGVVQALHVAGIIDRLHYMSTVSGGGYTGSSLTWFLAQDRGEMDRYGALKHNFPFCGGAAVAVRNAAEKPADVDETGAEDCPRPDGRAVLDFIRQRSSYLEPGAGLTKISAGAIVFRSLFVSLLGYALVASLIFLFLLWAGLFPDRSATASPAFSWDNWPLGVAALSAAALAFFAFVYSLVTPMPVGERFNYTYRRVYQIVSGFLLAAVLAGIALALIFELILLFREWRFTAGKLNFQGLPILAATWAAAGAGGGFLMKRLQEASSAGLVRLATIALPPICLILLVAGLGSIGYMVADWVRGSGLWKWLLGLTVLYCLYTNINLTGLHRFYRDRLMETFMPDRESIEKDSRAGTTSANHMDLADICDSEDDGPYQLLNTHVVLMGGRKARFRSRMGDSFVMSRLFCGSEATGYVRTKTWLKPRRLVLARPVGTMSLPTAMAISGAALNPNAGGDGQGLTKSPAVSAVLNLLNLRLGYWVPSPRPGLLNMRRPSHWWPPNFLFPGVLQGLLGLSHHEHSDWLELSDGGHFENTGMYELVRRGVTTLVVVDGSTDPDIAMQSFANALEKIYIDFNVTVHFDSKQKDLHFTNLMKGTGEPRDTIAEKLHFAKAGFAVGTIEYPEVNGEKKTGHLIYIKSTMVRDLPAALYSYKATNPLFPSESLADQFFSEQQFEAYRALGFAIAKSMTTEVKAGADWGKAFGVADPKTEDGPVDKTGSESGSLRSGSPPRALSASPAEASDCEAGLRKSEPREGRPGKSR